jgi:hypothetical protein
MPRIAERLEFMNAKAVKVCIKAGSGRSPGHKNLCVSANFHSSYFEKGNS